MQDKINETLLKSKTTQMELSFEDEDRTEVFEIRFSKLNEKHVIAVCRDISESYSQRKAIEEANHKLLIINAELEELVQKETQKRLVQEKIILEQKRFADIGQMMNAIAHQWRQPLNNLGLMTQLLEEDYLKNIIDNDYMEEFKDSSLNIIQYLSDTIDEFRNFFKPEKEKQHFDIFHLINSTYTLIKAQMESSGIVFTSRCKCGMECKVFGFEKEPGTCDLHDMKVFGYEGELKQILIVLFQNAKDAVLQRKKAGEIDKGIINVTIKMLGQSGYEIIVDDNGGGVNPDVIERIFDPYFTTKGPEVGTGIGLYMSRMIIEEHFNGKIIVENNDNGAVFTIQLPNGM